MRIKFMTWNTQLYEYGNLRGKTLEKGKEIYKQDVEQIIVNQFNMLNKDEKAVVVLQEIPYKIKQSGKWDSNPVFELFKKTFIDDKYDITYLSGTREWHIKMTVVIASKGLIKNCDVAKNNIYIPFEIKNLNLKVLALHSHNAFEAREWLGENDTFKPNIIIGDFNSGNYIKDKNDNSITINRKNYLYLTEGYIDICQGMYTTKYKTQIDHVLLQNDSEFQYKYENVKVDYDIMISDHYPVYFDMVFENNS